MDTSRALSLETPAVVNEAVAKVERQVERASLFTHTALSDLAARMTEVESLVHGLVNALVDSGVAPEASIIEAGMRARDELVENGPPPGPGVALRVDGESTNVASVVNCAELLPICQAACCRLSFALSAVEVEAGIIKWDLGAPYHNRQEANGYCTHCSIDDRSCEIYEDRPSVCSAYDCSRDTRVWIDFDARELNHAWIDAHLGPNRPRLTRVDIRRSA
jgi:Putative zinc- or iron-chelating domain